MMSLRREESVLKRTSVSEIQTIPALRRGAEIHPPTPCYSDPNVKATCSEMNRR
jgi:hypothetical protein